MTFSLTDNDAGEKSSFESERVDVFVGLTQLVPAFVVEPVETLLARFDSHNFAAGRGGDDAEGVGEGTKDAI